MGRKKRNFSLEIDNKTHYSQRDLRKFIYAGIIESGMRRWDNNWRVTVVYSRKKGKCTGWAWLGGRFIHLEFQNMILI